MSRLRVLTLAMVLVVIFAFSAHADPGDLDPTFGSGGIAITRVSVKDDHPFDVAVQSDGKIVVVGSVWDPQDILSDFGVVRYNPDGTLDDGTLDLSFSRNGWVATPIGTASAFAFASAIQADGKLLVAGISQSESNAGYDFTLARYLT